VSQPRKPAPRGPIPNLMVVAVALITSGLASITIPICVPGDADSGGYVALGVLALFIGAVLCWMALPEKDWRPDDRER
jgi:hypothetical protein